MEKPKDSNSVLSDDLSDVSLQLENESNTIEDSLLTSEEDSYISDKKSYKNEVGKRKPPILDSTRELGDSSVLNASINNSEIIDNSYSSDQAEDAVQKSPKRSSIRNRRHISVRNQNEHVSSSECEESFIKPRVKKNRIISSDSSDTDIVTLRPKGKTKSGKIFNKISDSSDNDESIDLKLGKPSNRSASINEYSKHDSIRSTHEDSSYRRRNRTSTGSNPDNSNISKNKDQSDIVSIDEIQNISNSDKTVDLGVAIPVLNKYVPQDTSFEQYNSRLKSPDKSSDFRQKQPISHLSSDGVNISNQTKMGYKSAIDKMNINEEVANMSLELSKSRISERQFDSINIGESDLSETEQPSKVRTPSLRLTEEFHLGQGRKFMHSTILEPQDTPHNKNTGKRLLNKSIDTPRLIKQIKESDTPRNVPRILSSSSSSDEEIHESDDDDIIDVSSDEEVLPKTPARTKLKQTKLDDLILKNKTSITVESEKEDTSSVIEVTPAEYNQQNYKIKGLETDLLKAKNLMRVVKLEHLPDNGKSILLRHDSLEMQLLEAVKKLSMMKVTKENPSVISVANTNPQSKVKILSWEEIENRAGVVQPKTFGKQAMSTYNAQKAVTMDRLHQLHGSLKTCPTEDDLTEDPKGLKVDLMPHQRRALTWLMWREMQKPSGGILADDMGLGKTLTMISLMLKMNEIERDTEESSDEENSPRKVPKYNGGTLVVCPASLINQWSGELERRTKRGLASCEMYHGPKRETKPKKLAKYDMVITTYAIVNNECDKNGAIFKVKWKRIVIDEAHQIRNHKSQTSEAVCKLSAKSRWALTGTPVHNKELDMYALLKFLRCTPFDDLTVWKKWVGDKSTGGTERLHTVISSLMLRRTKIELIEKGFLNAMPERRWELVPVELNKMERDVYSKILIFSRTLFAQFLHQRAEKNQDTFLAQHDNFNQQPNGQNKEYVKMREKLLKLNKLKDVKQHEILVLLLRLRQICCHASLITGMLNEDMDILGEDDGGDKGEALDLLEQLNKLTIDGDEYHPNSNVAEGIGEEALGLKEAARGVLNPSDPVFSETRMSSKIKKLIKVLRNNVIEKNDKAIIVSQWSSFLRLISYHLKSEKISFDQLDGNVPVPKRMAMVDRFNDPKDKMKVLLLSLTAGGVGLNLIGANHLFLLDLHWNPQLENQAQDRIYRMGQKKDVFVYKFMATDTIEKRILDLQEKKLEIAQSMLTGTKQAITSKLSLQDLKMLFEM